MKKILVKVALVCGITLLGATNPSYASYEEIILNMDYHETIAEYKTYDEYKNNKKIQDKLTQIEKELAVIEEEAIQIKKDIDDHERENGGEMKDPQLLVNQLENNTDYYNLGKRLLNLAFEMYENDDYDYSQDKIEVDNSYKYIKAGAYSRDDLVENKEKLEKSLKESKTKLESLEFLFNYTPSTIAGVRDKLDKLYEKSKLLIIKAEDALDEYNQILAE